MLLTDLQRYRSLMKMAPQLDPDFIPPVFMIAECNREEILKASIFSEDNRVTEFPIPYHPLMYKSPLYMNIFIKFLLWSRGGYRVDIECNEKSIAGKVRKTWDVEGQRGFDCRLMSRIYNREFTFNTRTPDTIKVSSEQEEKVGGHFDGCRIGFDLGASDYKICAMKDGKVIFAEEYPWNPKDQNDPQYHINHIKNGIEIAASKLPHLDAIGGSSAGVYVNNRVMEASLFRSLSKEDFQNRIQNLFIDMSRERKVPLKIINDGDVTALAGSLSTSRTAMLGIAMGSSEAAGYINSEGNITGWLNELAFAPVDLNPEAPVDEWSGDKGTGAQYFSQMAVSRLAVKAGYSFPESLPLPEKLVQIQQDVKKGDKRAENIFRTIGRYLGYTIPWYNVFYKFDNIMVLGRVTSGKGGELILEEAQEVLKVEFPDLYKKVSVFIPDEKSRRTGQAAAAATLPVVER